MKVNFKDIFQMVSLDFVLSDPNNMLLGIEYLLSKGEDFDYCGIEDEILNNVGDYSIELSKSDTYMLLLMHKLLLEADQSEIDEALDFIRDNHFVDSLLQTSFDSYRMKVRGKRIKRILDLTATIQSASVIVMDSVDKYHYVPMTEHDTIHKYVDFCSEVRTEPIDIVSKTFDEALSNVSNKDYDAVIVDDTLLDNNSFFDTLRTIGFKSVISFNFGEVEFINLETWPLLS